jgi:hypothetical protein
MQLLRTALLAGAAAFAIFGTASAQTDNVMTVALPGGGIVGIRYTGNIPPKVVIGEAPPANAAWMPVSSFFGPASPFAMMERISAEAPYSRVADVQAGLGFLAAQEADPERLDAGEALRQVMDATLAWYREHRPAKS